MFVLCPLGFLSREDLVAFAVEDSQSDRLRRPLYLRGGDDGGGRVSHFNLFFCEIGRAAVDGSANELDPECPRLFRNDLGWWVRLPEEED